jgi:hypothetical protein
MTMVWKSKDYMILTKKKSILNKIYFYNEDIKVYDK